MKSQLFIMVLFLFNSVLVNGQDNNGRIQTNLDELTGMRFESSVSEAEGSPYINKIFTHAKIGEYPQLFNLRYNAYKDEFEFIDQKNDTLVLNKSETYGNVFFTVLKKNYSLVTYNEKKNTSITGYLIVIHQKDDFILYKKQKVNFYAAKKGTTSYESDRPAKYVPVGDRYYFKNKEQEIVEFPSSKKEFLKLFPEKKTEIEGFIKKNSIDFEKENDIVKLIDFAKAK